jgi:hypothetical protein
VSRYIDEHRGRFGVEPICRTLGVSAPAYYQRATGKRSARQLEDEQLLERIREVHETSYCAYGYRRTWKALRRAGEHAPRCQVQRLMRANGIQGAKRRGKPWRTTTPDPDARRRPDLVNRDFTASAPNELWVADFSYLRCWEGVVFFSFVIDVYSRKGSRRSASYITAKGAANTSAGTTRRRSPSRRARIGRQHRRRIRQQHGRELRRHLQDGAYRRPRVAHPQPDGARDRRIHRLVQRHPPARKPRRPATPRDRITPRCEKHSPNHPT